MTSQKQIAANQRNAKSSTGATTPLGKSITGLNAKRGGFTGKITTLSEEDRPIFEKFKSQFIPDLAPKTTVELSLATAIARDTWRLNHLRAVEMKAERKHNYQQDRADEITLARYSHIEGLTYQVPATPTPNGSVFSNNEIFAAADRDTTLTIAKGVIGRTPPQVQFAGATSGAPANVVNWPTPDAA